jgi:hypothetical protein
MVINVGFINNFVKLAMPLTNLFEKYLGYKIMKEHVRWFSSHSRAFL